VEGEEPLTHRARGIPRAVATRHGRAVDDDELDELEQAVRALRERWEREDPGWVPLAIDLAGNRVPELIREMRRRRERDRLH
jgi:hypothetical protein